ncbi:MAG: hypothetical protein JSR82_19235 [Verrucomicrobia bacterium]|nr:hypothetical protein [Verrucomicrobiota bacterium]
MGAPSPRSSHTAVWTGSEMIVYGGTAAAGAVEDGARYAFATNSWTTLPAISPGNPMPRTKHSAIWTGTEMIVWGGSSSASQLNPLNSGARYHRANNAWSLTAPGPAGRASHACCWTGSEMIIWGGAVPGGSPGIVVTLNDGARYDPAGNAWTTMQGTPPLGRSEPATLWTGTLFVVWGNSPNEGGAYSPERNNWQPIALLNAPTPRLHGSFVWTGTQGIYFGGADLALGPISSNETWAYTPARFLHLYARP